MKRHLSCPGVADSAQLQARRDKSPVPAFIPRLQHARGRGKSRWPILFLAVVLWPWGWIAPPVTADGLRAVGISAPNSHTHLLSDSTMIAPREALTCGEPVSGSITVAGQRDTYAFAADQGDRVWLSLVKTGGDFWPGVTVYAPSGATVTSFWTTSGTAPLLPPLPETGVYTVEVYDYPDNNRAEIGRAHV